MSSPAKSIMEYGDHGIVIEIECHLTNGLPNILIVGMANKSIEEAKERIRSAFAGVKLELPKKRITINLAPSDITKEGAGFDLAIAVSILAASGQITKNLDDTLVIGELGLDGTVRPIRGIIGKLLHGRDKGYRRCYIPRANARQARLVPNVEVVPVRNLRELYLDLTDTVKIKALKTGRSDHAGSRESQYTLDFSDVVGQARAKRALEIAAAGSHNILLNGPPGVGKSMLAKALPSILPPMSLEEKLEVTHLHSLASKDYEKIIHERPFRSPHHSASQIAIIGGGQYPRPGEISLSHQGILFFDEFPEFNRAAIEALRQPLEDRVITVSRARDSVTFPANFILVATSNPCPCGHYGTSKDCICMPHEIHKYNRKVSGPIIDRIDIYVNVDEVQHESLLSDQKSESSARIRRRITEARSIQAARFKDTKRTNASLSNRDIKKHALLTPEAQILLNRAAKQLDISARSYMRTIKVARTIADLENQEQVLAPHISEALQYRRQVNVT